MKCVVVRVGVYGYVGWVSGRILS